MQVFTIPDVIDMFEYYNPNITMGEIFKGMRIANATFVLEFSDKGLDKDYILNTPLRHVGIFQGSLPASS